MKKIFAKITWILAAGIIAFAAAGCSNIENETSAMAQQGVCRIAFNSNETITDIKLKGTNKATAVTKTYGSWADAAEVSAATVEIPAGSYVFTLSAQYDGSTVKGTCDV